MGDKKEVESTPADGVCVIARGEVVCAPMVRGSELAFRQLVRGYGVRTAFTPMLRAQRIIDKHPDDYALVEEAAACSDDRPLVVQICGREPHVLAEACRIILTKIPDVGGIDFNLGCPQVLAERDKFGAFLLLQDPDRAVMCVKAMCEAIPGTPVSCKIRPLPSTADTVNVARQLQNAGCTLLSVHCRRREQKHYGVPDYGVAAALATNLDIPVVVNGGITSTADAARIMESTGAYAAMVANALLADPRALVPQQKERDPAALAWEYLSFAERFPPPSPLYTRMHLRWIFRTLLKPAATEDMEALFRGPDAWKAKLWTFLARPYIKTIWQFRELVRLIVVQRERAHATADGGNRSWKPPPDDELDGEPSFRSVRQGRRGEAKGNTPSMVVAGAPPAKRAKIDRK